MLFDKNCRNRTSQGSLVNFEKSLHYFNIQKIQIFIPFQVFQVEGGSLFGLTKTILSSKIIAKDSLNKKKSQKVLKNEI